MRRLSLSARMGLLFAVCTAAVSLLAGVLFDRASETHFIELDRQLLESRLAVFRSLLSGVEHPTQLDARRAGVEQELARHPDLGLHLEGPAGEPWFDSLPNVTEPPANHHAASGGGRDAVAYRTLDAPLDDSRADSPRLRLLLDITHHQHFLERMQRLIWLTVGLSALATALLGAWVARDGLRPLRRMTELAARISARSLTERLPEDQAPAELAELIATFNGMLARLEDAFGRLSAFSADIAHELRTPLSNLLTQTQVVLGRDRPAEEYRETLHSNLEELQRLAQMVNDMLFLAKAEHGLLAPNRQPLQLAEELDALLDYFAPLAEERHIELRRHGVACLAADRSMLRRALSNLLDNALRFTPDDGQVCVDLAETQSGVNIRLANSGPPIPADALPRLFDRFYRADPARREGSGEHAGLGLAITRSIVLAHGGEIRVETGADGTCFVLAFARPESLRR
ncbi:heavy metal sensor histidine kinase [Pseudomonas sp. RIT-PI-AD]|uniref:heavy metal sensor histidine kinase n=1 Tax=Pseudomonas sp. RIT-PI-AD TaxID=3035294 RepID=UPI0023EE49E2|nr:heavy metal sensor histidine kinase [Pseudomonas sp. RIT-PI-AD]